MFQVQPRRGAGAGDWLDLHLTQSTTGYTRIFGNDGDTNGSARIDFFYNMAVFGQTASTTYFTGSFIMNRLGDATSTANMFESSKIGLQPSLWSTDLGGASDTLFAYISAKPNTGTADKMRVAFTQQIGFTGDHLSIQVKNQRTRTLSGSIGINNSDPSAHLDIVEDEAARTIIRVKGHASQSGDFVDLINSSSVSLFKVGADGRAYLKALNSAPTDGNIAASQVTWYLDESNNKLKVRVKYAGGTLKTGEVALV